MIPSLFRANPASSTVKVVVATLLVARLNGVMKSVPATFAWPVTTSSLIPGLARLRLMFRTPVEVWVKLPERVVVSTRSTPPGDNLPEFVRLPSPKAPRDSELPESMTPCAVFVTLTKLLPSIDPSITPELVMLPGPSMKTATPLIPAVDFTVPSLVSTLSTP